MKEPQFGSNRIQSFVEFFTTFGKVKFGMEGLELFASLNDSKFFKVSAENLLLPAVTSSVYQLGTTPVTTVSISEYGDGRDMTTVLTLTDFIVGALAGAGAALGVGNIVYAFPAGAHLELATYANLSLKCAGTAVNTDTGLGSVIATGAVNVLSGTATFEDRFTGQTIATAAAGGTAVANLLGATAGLGTGIALNTVSKVKNVFLNSAGTWNVNNTGSLTATGTIVLKWTKMGA